MDLSLSNCSPVPIILDFPGIIYLCLQPRDLFRLGGWVALCCTLTNCHSVLISSNKMFCCVRQPGYFIIAEFWLYKDTNVHELSFAGNRNDHHRDGFSSLHKAELVNPFFNEPHNSVDLRTSMAHYPNGLHLSPSIENWNRTLPLSRRVRQSRLSPYSAENCFQGLHFHRRMLTRYYDITKQGKVCILPAPWGLSKVYNIALQK